MPRSLLYPTGKKTTNVLNIVIMNNPTTTAQQLHIDRYIFSFKMHASFREKQPEVLAKWAKENINDTLVAINTVIVPYSFSSKKWTRPFIILCVFNKLCIQFQLCNRSRNTTGASSPGSAAPSTAPMELTAFPMEHTRAVWLLLTAFGWDSPFQNHWKIK